MSATLKIYNGFSVVINGVVTRGGRRDVPVEITINGQKHDANFSITNTSGDDFNSDVVWQSGDSGLDTFAFMHLRVDQDCVVELRNANATDQYIAFEVKANVDFMLGGDAVGANDNATSVIGADGSVTTLDNVDQITVKNNTTGADADVIASGRLVLLK
jgi:hypothetical protein